jgi:hypothetical protein
MTEAQRRFLTLTLTLTLTLILTLALTLTLTLTLTQGDRRRDDGGAEQVLDDGDGLEVQRVEVCGQLDEDGLEQGW